MLLLKKFTGLLILNYVILADAWFPIKYVYGYNHYTQDTSERYHVETYNDGELKNAAALSFYLFGPLWTFYFFIGAVIAFFIVLIYLLNWPCKSRFKSTSVRR